MGKNHFAPNELVTVFQKVIPSIRSTLPKKDLENILASIGSWIEQGGSVDILYKNQGKN